MPEELILPHGHHIEVSDIEGANDILLAAHQSGVRVEVAALSGGEYSVVGASGVRETVRVGEGKVALKVGRGSTPAKVLQHAKRRFSLRDSRLAFREREEARRSRG